MRERGRVNITLPTFQRVNRAKYCERIYCTKDTSGLSLYPARCRNSYATTRGWLNALNPGNTYPSLPPFHFVTSFLVAGCQALRAAKSRRLARARILLNPGYQAAVDGSVRQCSASVRLLPASLVRQEPCIRRGRRHRRAWSNDVGQTGAFRVARDHDRLAPCRTLPSR